MVEPKYFEKFEEGEVLESQWRVVSESTMRRFLDLTGLREPAFEDKQELKELNEFMGVSGENENWIVPGYLTLCLSLGLAEEWFVYVGRALLGLDDLTFDHPVRVGDELRTVVEVTNTDPTSSDRVGKVELTWNPEIRTGETVLTMDSDHLIKKRPD